MRKGRNGGGEKIGADDAHLGTGDVAAGGGIEDPPRHGTGGFGGDKPVGAEDFAVKLFEGHYPGDTDATARSALRDRLKQDLIRTETSLKRTASFGRNCTKPSKSSDTTVAILG